MKNTFSILFRQLLLVMSILLCYTEVHSQIISTVINTTGVAVINSLARDTTGNLYFSSYFSASVKKVSASGLLTTVAGNGSAGFSGDGGPATAAQLNAPKAIVMDSTGNIYVCDSWNNRVRKISASGVITTFAGNGGWGISGDGGPAVSAQIYSPFGIDIDAYGNVYISTNSSVRKVSVSGIISTVAGNGSVGFSGDGGPATLARLGDVTGIKVDHLGNLLICDKGNQRVRMVDTSGIITTIAGNGTAGYSGNGGPATAATICDPLDIAIDLAGNIYIALFNGHCVRKVTPAGMIYAYAGSSASGYSGDGGPATAATLGEPVGIVADDTGNIYIAASTITIRKVSSCLPFVLPVTGVSSLCLGASAVLTDLSASGLWSSSNVSIVTIDAATGIATGVSNGIATVSYSVTNSCGTIISAHTLNIETILPDAGVIIGDSAICIGNSITLSDTSSTGIWVSADAATGVVSATGIVTGVTSGIVGIMYITSNSCGVDTALHNVVIDRPLESAGEILGADSVCSGMVVTLTSSVVGGIWSSNDTSVATIASLTGTATAVTPGSAIIHYTMSNTCNSIFTPYLFVVKNEADCESGTGNFLLAHGGIQIYPNPNHGSFIIDLAKPVNKEAVVTITNVLGQQVRQFFIQGNTTSKVEKIKVLDIPKGVYLVSAIINGERRLEKIIIE